MCPLCLSAAAVGWMAAGTVTAAGLAALTAGRFRGKTKDVPQFRDAAKSSRRQV